MKPLSERSATRPSCKICFNICADCGKLFSAKRKNQIRCHTCGDPVIKNRMQKGLVKIERKCMNPACRKPFTTYKKNQFACDSKICQNIVANIRRRPKLKKRRSAGLCSDCGAETNGKSKCDRCLGLARASIKMRRFKAKMNNLCRECCNNPVEDGQYYCNECVMKKFGQRICVTDGCVNTPERGYRYCQDCLDLMEAEKNSCKVYFKICPVCSKLFSSKENLTVYCGDGCRNAANYYGAIVKTEVRVCKECGKPFSSYDRNVQAVYCSETCSKRAGRRNGKHVRRLRKRAAFKETVNKHVVFSRDGGRCQICGRELSLGTKHPHPRSVTIDHIIPLAKGGEHSYRNVQLACFECNSLKSDNILDGNGEVYQSIINYYVVA